MQRFFFLKMSSFFKYFCYTLKSVKNVCLKILFFVRVGKTFLQHKIFLISTPTQVGPGNISEEMYPSKLKNKLSMFPENKLIFLHR